MGNMTTPLEDRVTELEIAFVELYKYAHLTQAQKDELEAIAERDKYLEEERNRVELEIGKIKRKDG